MFWVLPEMDSELVEPLPDTVPDTDAVPSTGATPGAELTVASPVIEPVDVIVWGTEKLRLLAVPEISVLESPEPLRVRTLPVPPELVVEQVPVSAEENAGRAVVTGVAAITEAMNATLAERRAFTSYTLFSVSFSHFSEAFQP